MKSVTVFDSQHEFPHWQLRLPKGLYSLLVECSDLLYSLYGVFILTEYIFFI